MIKRLVTALALAAMLGSASLAVTTSVQAGIIVEPRNAAEFCRELDERGLLAQEGVTRGECVNVFNGPSSANSNNFIAGLCGYDFVRAEVGVTTKGQCIKFFRQRFSEI